MSSNLLWLQKSQYREVKLLYNFWNALYNLPNEYQNADYGPLLVEQRRFCKPSGRVYTANTFSSNMQFLKIWL